MSELTNKSGNVGNDGLLQQGEAAHDGCIFLFFFKEEKKDRKKQGKRKKKGKEKKRNKQRDMVRLHSSQ